MLGRALSGLRGRLVALVLLGVIPALAMILYTAADQRRAATTDALANARRLAHLAARNQERLIEAGRQLLVALAQLREVRDRDAAACTALFGRLLKLYPVHANLGAMTANGDVFCSAVPARRRVNVADETFFRRAVEARGFAVGDYLVGPISGKQVLALAHAVLDGSGRLSGVVAAALDLAWLNRFAAEADLPLGSTLTVIDRNGTVLVRFPDPEAWVGRAIPEAPLSRAILIRDGADTLEAPGLDGHPRLFGFARLSVTPGGPDAYVTISIPRDIAFAESNRLLKRNLIALAIIALLALVAAGAGAEVLILRPTKALVRTTSQLTAGELAARTGLSSTGGEIGELARAFDEMAESLDRRSAELHALTDEKTRLQDEAERRRREAETLEEVARTINTSLDLDAVLDRVARAAQRLCGSDLSGIALRDGQSDAMVYRYWIGGPVGPVWRIEPGKGLGGRVLLTGRPYRTADYAGDPVITKDYLGKAEDSGVVAAAAVPIRRAARVEGLLLVARKSARGFTDEDEGVLVRLADHAAIALGNAQLFAGEQAARARAESSEARYRNLYEGVPVGLYRSAPDGRILDANLAFVHMLGYPDRAALLVVDARDLYVDPEERRRWQARMEQDGAVDSFERQLRRADGALVWVEDTSRVVRSPDGEVHYYEGSLRDVTERRRGRLELGARAQQQAAVAELGQRAMAAADLATLMDDAVTLVAGTLGVEYSEVLELLPDGKVLAPRAGVGWQEEVASGTTVPAGTDSQAGYTLQSREPVIVEDLRAETRFTPSPIMTASEVVSGMSVSILGGGRPFGVLGVHSTRPRTFTADDVHFLQSVANILAQAIERDRAARAVRQSEQHHRALIENALDIITVLDHEGTIVYESPSVERILGYHPSELIGQQAFHLLHLDDAPAVLTLFAEGVSTPGLTASIEFRFRHKDGSWRAFEAIGRSLFEEPSVRGIVLNSRDITERKRAEEEIQRQRDALMQREKLAAMGELLAGVAHELNNPLSVVMGQTVLLRKLATDSALRARADKIVAAADRCARIVKNFLALARQHPLERRSVRLNEVVREAAELLAYQLRVDDVKVELDLTLDLPELWADPHQLHQVAVNLVSNAHQAMRQAAPPRRLTITTRSDQSRKQVTLTMADTGPGVPPGIRQRIFEPFFTTKPTGQGTGLGLSLCRGIVEEHGGSIRAEGAPGGGAVFVVELPVEAPSEIARETRKMEAAAPVRGRRILIVDDEPEVAEVLADLLAVDNHQTESAANGILALDKLREGTYDVILSDVRMPGLDGLGLYREIERHYPDLLGRFIFVTGDALSPETRTLLERTGAPNLGKPFVLEEIRQRIQQALRAR